MIIAPPPILEVDWLAEMFVGGAVKSREFGPRMAEVAARCRAAFLDAGTIVESSTVDGIHLEAEAHRVLGSAVARIIEHHFPDGSSRAKTTSSPLGITSTGIRAPPRIGADAET